MNHYYILENGSVICSKWDLTPGSPYQNSTISRMAIKADYDAAQIEDRRRIRLVASLRPKREAFWIDGAGVHHKRERSPRRKRTSK